MKVRETAGITDKILDFVANLEYEDIPSDAIHEAKRLLLDSLGCALGGLSVTKGKIVVKMASRLGGPQESSIWGTSDRVSSPAAAFANGNLANALDMDALMFPGGHVPPCVIPAPVALGEYQGCRGKDLIVAIALVHELACRISGGMKYWREIISEGPERGTMTWPEVSGLSTPIMAGALGCGKLLNLDKERLGNALGIAGHFCPIPSTSKWENTVPSPMTKYLDMGWVSQAEVQAVLLAQIGYTGDATIMEGPYGFWKMFGSVRWDPEKVIDKLGENWFLPRKTIYKPYPCCRGMHGGLDCFIYLIEKHNLRPEEISKVIILTDPIVDRHLWRSRKLVTHVDAQFNAAYPFAAAAYRLVPGPTWQSKEALENPEIISFMNRVTLGTYPRYGELLLEDPRSPISSVEVAARGKTFIEERRWIKGNPYPDSARMTDKELIEKFKNNASRVLPSNKIDRAMEAVMEIEKLMSTRELISQITL